MDKKMADLEEARLKRKADAAEEEDQQRKQAEEEFGRYFSGIM